MVMAFKAMTFQQQLAIMTQANLHINWLFKLAILNSATSNILTPHALLI